MSLPLTCPTCDFDFEVDPAWFLNNSRICCMNCSKAWEPSFTFYEKDMISKSKTVKKEIPKIEEDNYEIDRWNTDFDFDLKKEDTQKAVEMATDEMFNAFEKIFYDAKNTATVRKTNIITYKNWCKRTRFS